MNKSWHDLFCFQKFIILYFAFVKNTSRVPDKFIRMAVAYSIR